MLMDKSEEWWRDYCKTPIGADENACNIHFHGTNLQTNRGNEQRLSLFFCIFACIINSIAWQLPILTYKI